MTVAEASDIASRKGMTARESDRIRAAPGIQVCSVQDSNRSAIHPTKQMFMDRFNGFQEVVCARCVRKADTLQSRDTCPGNDVDCEAGVADAISARWRCHI